MALKKVALARDKERASVLAAASAVM